MRSSEEILLHERMSGIVVQQMINHVPWKFQCWAEAQGYPIQADFQATILSEKMDPSLLLRRNLFSMNLDYQQEYLQLLSAYPYRMENFILDCIRILVRTKNISEAIIRLKRYSFIQDILMHSNGFITIESDYGNYSFVPIVNVYEKEFKKIQEIHKRYFHSTIFFPAMNGYSPDEPGNLDYNCHFASWQFLQMFPESYLSTSLCPYHLWGSDWFHSFILTPNKTFVVDVANGFIMDSVSYQKLVDPNEIYSFQGIQIEEAMRGTFGSFSRGDVLKLALYHYDYDCNREIFPSCKK